MISTKLHWVEGPWVGALALAARPRGGGWLEDEMASWRAEGADTVVSLLTKSEESELDIGDEQAQARAHGMNFLSFPIVDRQVPSLDQSFNQALDELGRELAKGRNIVVHCRQGVGRTGLIAACLLVSKGQDPRSAVARLSAARGLSVPETPEQRLWIDRYAESVGALR